MEYKLQTYQYIKISVDGPLSVATPWPRLGHSKNTFDLFDIFKNDLIRLLMTEELKKLNL